MFSYVFLQVSKLYSLFLAPCTLFPFSSHIYESYCLHELGAHMYLLLPPLPKLWYHRACFPTLSFIILSWSCMIDAPICVILVINIFHCHCHCHWTTSWKWLNSTQNNSAKYNGLCVYQRILRIQYKYDTTESSCSFCYDNGICDFNMNDNATESSSFFPLLRAVYAIEMPCFQSIWCERARV